MFCIHNFNLLNKIPQIFWLFFTNNWRQMCRFYFLFNFLKLHFRFILLRVSTSPELCDRVCPYIVLTRLVKAQNRHDSTQRLISPRKTRIDSTRVLESNRFAHTTRLNEGYCSNQKKKKNVSWQLPFNLLFKFLYSECQKSSSQVELGGPLLDIHL